MGELYLICHGGLTYLIESNTGLEIYRLPLGLACQRVGLTFVSSYISLSQGAATNQKLNVEG